jgi:cell division protein ZapA
MKTDLDIKVEIGGRPYNMSVKREEEEFVRAAAKNVNETITRYSKSFEYKDLQDLYAMIALQYASVMMQMEKEKSFKDKEMKDKLEEIDEILSSQLKL